MAYTDWRVLGRGGNTKTYTVTVTANGAVTFPQEQVNGDYIMYIKWVGNASGSFDLTMPDGDSVDYLDGNGASQSGSSGWITPADRMIIDTTLTPTIASLTTITSLKLVFYVVE